MRKLIEITKLIINPKNFRFDPVKSEQEAIDLMLHEKEAEILNLAKHIVNHGLDPSKDVRVIQKNNLFLALDGNRRMTAVKCLNNPSLIKKESLKEKFQKLSDSFTQNPIKEISCFVFPDEESASIWLGLDHTGKNKGVGQDSWESPAIGRFNANFGQKPQLPISMQALEMLKQNQINIDEKSVSTTTVDRVLSNPEARSFLGIDVIKGKMEIVSDKDKALERLKIFFEKIINTKVGEVYNKAKIEDFLKTLFGEKKLEVDPKKALPLFNEDFEKENKNDATGSKSTEKIKLDTSFSKNNSQEKESSNQNSLYQNIYNPRQKDTGSVVKHIPGVPAVKSKKVQEIFKELGFLDAAKCPMMTAVNIRILLDILCRDLLKMSKKNDPGELKSRMATIAKEFGDKEMQNLIDALQKDVFTKKLNEIVHNTIFQINEQEARTIWNNIESFVNFVISKTIEIEK